MPSPPPPPADIEALDALAQRLMAAFTRAGYERVAPAVIQPADLFLDVVGESLRARTYVFTDPDGAELCLRPDLTVPTCRLHLERHADGQRAGALLLQRLGLPLSAGGRRPRASARVPPGRHRVVRRRRPRARTTPPCWRSPSRRCARPASRDVRLQLGDLGLFAALHQRAAHARALAPAPQAPAVWRPEAFRAELPRLASGAGAGRPGAARG